MVGAMISEGGLSEKRTLLEESEIGARVSI